MEIAWPVSRVNGKLSNDHIHSKRDSFQGDRLADRQQNSESILGPAILLCGGQSTRMGSDKNFLQFEGRPFLVRLLETVGTYCQPIVLVRSQADQRLPTLPKIESLMLTEDRFWQASDAHSNPSKRSESHSRPKRSQGPAVGIASGLLRLSEYFQQESNQAESQTKPIFICGNDSPLLHPATIVRLYQLWALAEADDDSLTSDTLIPDALIPLVNGKHQYLCSLISAKLQPAMERYLADCGRSLHRFFGQQNCVIVPEDRFQNIDDLNSFKNINSQDDYRQLSSE